MCIFNNTVCFCSDQCEKSTKINIQFNCEVDHFLFILFFVKTSISTVNQLLCRGLQHEIIQVSAKLINVNVN